MCVRLHNKYETLERKIIGCLSSLVEKTTHAQISTTVSRFGGTAFPPRRSLLEKDNTL